MAELTELFTVVIVVQLFYAFVITACAYALPSAALVYVSGFSDFGTDLTLQGVGDSIEDSLVSQTNIPVIELGALVFYSGNIILDLLINFAFAIPQMITMLLNGIMMLVNVDTNVFNIMQLFFSVVIVAVYFFGLIRLVTSIRSGRLV